MQYSIQLRISVLSDLLEEEVVRCWNRGDDWEEEARMGPRSTPLPPLPLHSSSWPQNAGSAPRAALYLLTQQLDRCQLPSQPFIGAWIFPLRRRPERSKQCRWTIRVGVFKHREQLERNSTIAHVISVMSKNPSLFTSCISPPKPADFSRRSENCPQHMSDTVPTISSEAIMGKITTWHPFLSCLQLTLADLLPDTLFYLIPS